jgi:tetratricopeptide (TPR) repeat protein
MQQYRVNVNLLIGMVVGTVVVAGATYALWRYQLNRNADALIVSGEDAVKAGDPRQAAREYSNYLSIRPLDDKARVKLANLWIDVTEQPVVQPEDWGRSIAILEDTVRRLPNEKELQRRLVDLYGRIGQIQQSLDHISLMLEKYPDDAELQGLQMEYLVRSQKFEGKDGAIEKCKKLIGYDDKADKFDKKRATAPDNVAAYTNFAMLMRSVQNKPELADRTMDQLVKMNPELPAAYLQRGQYYTSIGEADRGQRDIDKAYKLAPDDPDVLLTMAGRAETKDRPAEAEKYLDIGLKANPEDPRFYQGLASLEMRDMKYKEALEIVDQGLKTVPKDKNQNLLFYKVELQFLANDIDGVRRTAEEMQKAGFRKEFTEWMNARILLSQNKWYEAQKALVALQPAFGEGGMYADQLANQLGLAYEKSGQLDKAYTSYAGVVKRNPQNEPAKAGMQRVDAMRGLKPKNSDTRDLDDLVAKTLQLPKEQRDWSEIDKQLAVLAEDRKLEGAALDLFWAKLMLMREDYAAARKYLVAGRNKDPENIEIQRTAVLLLRADPSQGADKALRLLDQVTDKFGDKPELRLDRIDSLIVQNQKEPNREQLQQELAKLAEAPADWSENDKITFWNGLAGRYLMLGMRVEARANLERVAELRPNELPTRVAIFTLALEENDDVGMKDAQEKLLKVVGSKEDSNWLYSEARRLLSLYRRGQVGKESLDDVRQLTERAMRERPNWFELHLLSAETDLLNGDEKSALDHFEKAQELGRPNGNAVLLHVRLLLNAGKYARAKEILDQLPQEAREGDLGQVYADVLFNTGNTDEAIAVIEKSAAAAPESAERQLAMGQLITRALSNPELPEARQKELIAEANQALQKAVELNPESPQMWLALITFQVMSKDMEAAKSTMQQAQLALSEDQLIAVLAKGNEIMGQWFNAENVYLNALEIQPDNLLLAQELATFYLSNAYPRPDKIAKATPLVNKVLKAGAEKKLQPNDPSLLWARRAAAQMLAATGQYQQLLKAENLLASNAVGGTLPAEDRLRMVEILAPRPEPISRSRAKNLLEAVKSDQRRLGLQHELMLGQLYFALGDWEKCKTQMLTTVSRFPKSPDARIQYINMILQRGDEKDMNTAVRQMASLRELAPNDIRTIELMATLGAKTGQKDKVKAYLLGLLPKATPGAKLEENQIPLVEFVASQLVKLDDLENAEKLYRQVVASQRNKLYALADFLGTHRDIAQSMQLLEDSYKVDLTEPTLRVGIAAVRAQRDEVGDKYDAQIQSWLDRGLLEDPDSIALLMLQAEFYDVTKKYDEAAKIYEKLLARKEVAGITRAIVLNNLAFLVALAGNEAEAGVDPLKSVDEAANILGPTADILDTRAVVYTTQGNYAKAIEDLNYAVTDNPNAPKYFHKAVAHLGAGQNTAALEAWSKAESLSDDVRSTLNRMEFDLYDKTKAKIEQLRGQKLTRAAG